jgi:hypothetical protein
LARFLLGVFCRISFACKDLEQTGGARLAVNPYAATTYDKKYFSKDFA